MPKPCYPSSLPFWLPSSLWLVLFVCFGSPLQAAGIYTNSGNNTTGFTTGYSDGSPTIVSNGTDIVESTGGRFDFIPATVSGNFQISFQVESESYDGDFHLLLLNPGTDAGLDVRNSPQSTDTPSINIFQGSNFASYNQFFFPTAGQTLATAAPIDFPNMAWTQITISRVGDTIIDDVGGQIIEANIEGTGLENTLDIGLGGYATTYEDGLGEIFFRNIDVVPEPSMATLFCIGICALFAGKVGAKKIFRSKLRRAV